MCLRYCLQCMRFILFGKKKRKKKGKKNKEKPPDLNINELMENVTFATLNGDIKNKTKLAKLLQNNTLVIQDAAADKLIEEYKNRKFSLPGISHEKFIKKSMSKKRKILTKTLQEQFRKSDTELIRTAVILRKSKIADEILKGVNQKRFSLVSVSLSQTEDEEIDTKETIIKQLDDSLVANKSRRFTLADILRKPDDANKIFERYTQKLSLQRQSNKSGYVNNLLADMKKRKISIPDAWTESFHEKTGNAKEEILLAILEGKIAENSSKKKKIKQFMGRMKNKLKPNKSN